MTRLHSNERSFKEVFRAHKIFDIISLHICFMRVMRCPKTFALGGTSTLYGDYPKNATANEETNLYDRYTLKKSILKYGCPKFLLNQGWFFSFVIAYATYTTYTNCYLANRSWVSLGNWLHFVHWHFKTRWLWIYIFSAWLFFLPHFSFGSGKVGLLRKAWA